MKIIYIGGYGRSGSTLLDIILGQSKYIESGGEIVHAQRDIKENKKCTCNKFLEECTVWSKVYSEINSEISSHYHHLYELDSYSFIIKSLIPWYKPAKNLTDYYKKVNQIIYFSHGRSRISKHWPKVVVPVLLKPTPNILLPDT